MAHSAAASVIVAFVAVAVAGCESQGIRIGDPVPVMVADSSEGHEAEVIWAVGAKDCLSCQTAAASIRHLRRRFGHRVKMVAVAVDDEDNLVDGFVRVERLEMSVVHIGRREYVKLFGRTPVPSLIVAHERMVVAIWNDAEGVRAATNGPDPRLMQVVDSVLVVQ